MKILVIGAGPAGLMFSYMVKLLDHHHKVTILERGDEKAKKGWGITLPQHAFDLLLEWCPKFRPFLPKVAISSYHVNLNDRNICTVSNLKMYGISRNKFLRHLKKLCLSSGVVFHFNKEARDINSIQDKYDLIVGADGVHSTLRSENSALFGAKTGFGKNKFIWLAVNKNLKGLKLSFREYNAQLFIIWSYPYSAKMSTVIIECSEKVWKNLKLNKHSLPENCKILSRIFKNELNGHLLRYLPKTQWQSFPVVTNQHWFYKNMVLIGDALHTAHFSVGQGTHLAVVDAIQLALALQKKLVKAALQEFERTRKPQVLEIQNLSFAGMSWFEKIFEKFDSTNEMKLLEEIKKQFTQRLINFNNNQKTLFSKQVENL